MAGEGHDHDPEPHGGARGSGAVYELLDTIVIGCVIGLAAFSAEWLYRVWKAQREEVRYDLTPAGRAATDPPPGTDQPD